MTVRDKINEWLDERDEKGVATYGQTLTECPDDAYSWNEMLIEELLDGIQYAAKENIKLRKQLNTMCDAYATCERENAKLKEMLK